MFRFFTLCAILALSTLSADAAYITFNATTNEYTDLESMLPTLLEKSIAGWNNIIKETQDSITFTQSTNLKNYCNIDYTISAGTKIKGLQVFVQFIETASTSIATTEICAFSKQDGYYFPRIGLITMDVSKSEEWSKRVLDNVMEHEIGHILGLGTLWNSYGYVSNGAYGGSNGVYGYEQVGASDGVESVPVQRSQSSDLFHWDDRVLGGELMTGRMNGHFQPMSSVTVEALKDLGYQVWPNNADSFSLDENTYKNDTYDVWIDLYHDYTPLGTTAKIPLFSSGKLAYSTVTFSSASSSSSSSGSSSGVTNNYYYGDSRMHPSAWEISVTALLAVFAVALFG
eukprot:CAMPEP_0171523336 /NCGR_PEP_ID=MMETSP0959-20130129/8348_1 /TAXON_ID=87120 /ORGANISM="Aurantiochytrium limacinum, Strain ATCCMYA-1381" /LENGTH=341 /DNA_ID=CAMNT_0012063771 /DNA_START=289 /DNA_END=1311 /DNA_ORIENTATION=+